jgi:parallel beta-helix repeat protein
LTSRYITTQHKFNFDFDKLENSVVSDRIHIDNNWTAAKAAGICTGNGTYTDPYVIKDLIITTCPESGILIENSNAYLIIKNCTIGHAFYPNAGIKLVNVDNSQIINNDCSQNYYGIYLESCNNNTISGNRVSDTKGLGYVLAEGIKLIYSNNNVIMNNIANYTGYGGISLYVCKNNIISGNIANDAEGGGGIGLSTCENNIISENTVNNNGITKLEYYDIRSSDGISLYNCKNNIISYNNVNNNSRTGISLIDSDHNKISRNTVKNNYYGVRLEWSSSDNRISKNTIKNNDKYGVYLTKKSNNNIISGNKFSKNGVCIKESDCTGNIYWDNGLCIYIGSPFLEIIIYGSIVLIIIILVVVLEIRRRKTHDFWEKS